MRMMHESRPADANVWIVARARPKVASRTPRPSEPARRVYDPAPQNRPRVRLGHGKPSRTPADAVARFLRDMTAAAERTFPQWRERLVPDIEECCTSYDTRRSLLDVHPLDDYYFAGVVGLEASKIRGLFRPEESAELLSQIGDRAAGMTGRTDRLISDLVFAIIVRVAVSARSDLFKRDYDQVCKFILEHMGVGKFDETRHLLRDVCYRHNLGEPMARGIPRWWKTFAGRYELELSTPAESTAAPAVTRS